MNRTGGRIQSDGAAEFTGIRNEPGQLGAGSVEPNSKSRVPGLDTVDFDTVGNHYDLALAVVLLRLLALYWIEQNDHGLKWRAIHDAEMLAQSVVANAAYHKMISLERQRRD